MSESYRKKIVENKRTRRKVTESKKPKSHRRLHESDNENFKKRLEKALNDWVEINCNSNGEYEAYYDYRDVISVERISKMIDIAIDNGYSDWREAFWEANDDWLFDWEFDIRNQIDEQIENYLDKDLLDWYNDEIGEPLFDYLYDYIDKFNGIDFLSGANFDNIYVDIISGTPEEINGDFYAIEDIRNYLNDEGDKPDCMIGELLKQNGYTFEDLKDAVENGTNSKLLKSLIREIDNATYNYGGITVLAEVGPEELFRLKKMCKDKSGSITFGSDAYIGQFDWWNGSGSLFEIEIEKPFKIIGKNLYRILVEGEDKYTVDEVYGMSHSAYTNSFELNG